MEAYTNQTSVNLHVGTVSCHVTSGPPKSPPGPSIEDFGAVSASTGMVFLDIFGAINGFPDHAQMIPHKTIQVNLCVCRGWTAAYIAQNLLKQ